MRQLAELAQVWGLLKYYHPTVASGRYNWDSVLVSSLQQVLNPRHTTPFTTTIAALLAVPGKDTAAWYAPQADNPMRYRNHTLRWIHQCHYLTPGQQQQVYYIATHPHRGMNYYALPGDGTDSTVTTPNEQPYKQMLLPDVHYRLLALFRFWNVIQYYYPYKYAIGQPWQNVLRQLIPVVIHAKDTLSWHQCIARMAAAINDSHGGLWPEVYHTIAGKYAPPFYFRLVAGKAVVTQLTNSNLTRPSGLQVGAVLTHVNGVPIRQLIKKYWPYVPASNAGGKLKTMHAFVLNTFARKAHYRGTNKDGTKMSANLQQVERDFLKDYLHFFHMRSSDTCKMLNGNIGYVFFSNLTSRNLDSIMQLLMPAKAIIFDMRNYPANGAGIYRVPNYLLPRPALYARITYPDYSYPGRFHYTVANEGTSYHQVGKPNPNAYKGKVLLLVDSRTQSAAEWACMTLLTASHVIVIGTPSAGADGNVTRTLLPGGYAIAFSGLGIYFPDGRETQRCGIPIDVKVPCTVEDMVNDRDPVLEKALELVGRDGGAIRS
ncbi:peptidase, S41 family [Filimonas lacunae]|nr:peptidase, S41 family [Filimonas lacunae]